MSSTGDIPEALTARRRRNLRHALIYGAATAFAATLCLVALHILEGSHERSEPAFLLHWLRDGALGLPVAFIGAGLGLRLAAARSSGRGWLSLPAVVSLSTSALLIAGMPVHELLFFAREREDISLPVHLLREWLVALAATFCAAFLVNAIRTRRAGAPPVRAVALTAMTSFAVGVVAVAWLLLLQLQVSVPEAARGTLVLRTFRDGALTAPLVAFVIAGVIGGLARLRRTGRDTPLRRLGVAGGGAVALSVLIAFAAPVTERLLELFHHGQHPLVVDAKLLVLPGFSGGSLALHVADRALAVLPVLLAAGLIAAWLGARRGQPGPAPAATVPNATLVDTVAGESGEFWLPAMTRRDVLKLGAVAGVALSVPLRAATARADLVRSPKFTPFTRKLTFSDPISPAAPGAFVPTVTPNPAWGTPKLYEIEMRENEVEIIPGIGTRIFGYNGMYPGPTFRVRNREPAIVRFRNSLPVSTTIHNHGGHQPGLVRGDPITDADGFPNAFIFPGKFKDFMYPHIAPDGDTEHADFASTQWYHDHAMDITGPNVYAGLAGFYLLTDDAEEQLVATGVIPNADHDLPLALQDRRFDARGNLVYDPHGSQGALGDVFVVNGKAQPYIEVERRKYRLRFLNGANARYFQLELSSGAPFLVIGTDTWLLPFAIEQQSIQLAMSQRADVIVDFRNAPSEVFLMNLQEQTSPKKPGEVRRPGVPLAKFVVKDGPASNNASAVPGTPLRQHVRLRPEDVVTTRRFVFERGGGNWVINKRRFDPNRDDATPRLGEVERWIFQNNGGGWTHPVHVHLESMQIQQINGKAPTGIEAFKRDSVNLGPNGQASMLIRFRTFPGRYVFHCHNVEHEDMRMMAAFQVLL